MVENRTLSVKSYLHIDVGSKSSRRFSEEHYIQGAPNVLSTLNNFLFVSRYNGHAVDNVQTVSTHIGARLLAIHGPMEPSVPWLPRRLPHVLGNDSAF